MKKQGLFAKVTIDLKKKQVKRQPKISFLNIPFNFQSKFTQKYVRKKLDPEEKITKRLKKDEILGRDGSAFEYAGPTVYEYFYKKKLSEKEWVNVKKAMLKFIGVTLQVTGKNKMIYGDFHFNNVCFDGKNFFFIDNSSWTTYYGFVSEIFNFRGDLPEFFLSHIYFEKKDKIGQIFEDRLHQYKKSPLYWIGYVDPSKIMMFYLGYLFNFVYYYSKIIDKEAEKVILKLIEPDPRKREFVSQRILKK